MQLAARVLKGRRLPHDVILNITPGTVEIRCADGDGHTRTFIEAGCVVPDPNEGQEAASTLAGAGRSVSLRHRRIIRPHGQQGSADSSGESATVAASCPRGAHHWIRERIHDRTMAKNMSYLVSRKCLLGFPRHADIDYEICSHNLCRDLRADTEARANTAWSIVDRTS
ncbi:MAG: hypothetical protein KIT18_04250 [Burkholderiales bacterium]|nr:hypothetical protein [Burkholderiales bacterium]